MNIIKNKSGFGSALILMFLGLFSTLLILAGLVRFTVDARTDFRYFCYNDLQNTQKILLEQEKNLFALNPAAQALRIRLRHLYLELAIATAAENIPAVLQIYQWIEHVKQQQKILQSQQQIIINFAHAQVRFLLGRAYTNLLKKNRNRNSTWSEILQIHDGITLNTFTPAMAVSPDSKTEIAPVYLPNPDFENEQRITAIWTFLFFAKPSFQTMVKTNQFWSLKCASQPKNKEQLIPLVIADKL